MQLTDWVADGNGGQPLQTLRCGHDFGDRCTARRVAVRKVFGAIADVFVSDRIRIQIGDFLVAMIDVVLP